VTYTSWTVVPHSEEEEVWLVEWGVVGTQNKPGGGQ